MKKIINVFLCILVSGSCFCQDAPDKEMISAAEYYDLEGIIQEKFKDYVANLNTMANCSTEDECQQVKSSYLSNSENLFAPSQTFIQDFYYQDQQATNTRIAAYLEMLCGNYDNNGDYYSISIDSIHIIGKFMSKTTMNRYVLYGVFNINFKGKSKNSNVVGFGKKTRYFKVMADKRVDGFHIRFLQFYDSKGYGSRTVLKDYEEIDIGGNSSSGKPYDVIRIFNKGVIAFSHRDEASTAEAYACLSYSKSLGNSEIRRKADSILKLFIPDGDRNLGKRNTLIDQLQNALSAKAAELYRAHKYSEAKFFSDYGKDGKDLGIEADLNRWMNRIEKLNTPGKYYKLLDPEDDGDNKNPEIWLRYAQYLGSINSEMADTAFGTAQSQDENNIDVYMQEYKYYISKCYPDYRKASKALSRYNELSPHGYDAEKMQSELNLINAIIASMDENYNQLESMVGINANSDTGSIYLNALSKLIIHYAEASDPKTRELVAKNNDILSKTAVGKYTLAHIKLVSPEKNADSTQRAIELLKDAISLDGGHPSWMAELCNDYKIMSTFSNEQDETKNLLDAVTYYNKILGVQYFNKYTAYLGISDAYYRLALLDGSTDRYLILMKGYLDTLETKYCSIDRNSKYSLSNNALLKKLKGNLLVVSNTQLDTAITYYEASDNNDPEVDLGLAIAMRKKPDKEGSRHYLENALRKQISVAYLKSARIDQYLEEIPEYKKLLKSYGYN